MHRVGLTTAISLTNSARCCSKTVGLEDRFLGIGVVDIVVVCGLEFLGWVEGLNEKRKAIC